MQLGTRWPVGGTAPARLPDAVVAAVHAVEQELASIGTDTAGWGWTLTWLEGRPVVDLDDGTRITFIPEDGTAVTGLADDGLADDGPDEA